MGAAPCSTVLDQCPNKTSRSSVYSALSGRTRSLGALRGRGYNKLIFLAGFPISGVDLGR